jgi:hypothetical protein
MIKWGSKDDGCIRLEEKTYRLSMFLLMELLGPFLRTAPPRGLPLDLQARVPNSYLPTMNRGRY